AASGLVFGPHLPPVGKHLGKVHSTIGSGSGNLPLLIMGKARGNKTMSGSSKSSDGGRNGELTSGVEPACFQTDRSEASLTSNMSKTVGEEVSEFRHNTAQSQAEIINSAGDCADDEEDDAMDTDPPSADDSSLTGPNSTLTDIPLPKEGKLSSANKKRAQPVKASTASASLAVSSASAPLKYIGPQVTPEIAKKFGLQFSKEETPTGSKRKINSLSAIQAKRVANPTVFDEVKPPDFIIPPDKVEEYKGDSK
ncbi:unnamed protein product, partial [Protopolystoma xenopodis]